MPAETTKTTRRRRPAPQWDHCRDPHVEVGESDGVLAGRSACGWEMVTAVRYVYQDTVYYTFFWKRPAPPTDGA